MLENINCIMYVSYLFYLCGLSFSIWQGINASMWSKRLYWITCAGLMLLGTFGMIYFFIYSPVYHDPFGCSSGKMPAGFGLSTALVYSGLLCTAVGAVWRQVRKIFPRLIAN